VDLYMTHRVQGAHVVLEVAGEIDVDTAPGLQERLDGLVDEGHHHLVVDMEDVDFLDSAALGVLVNGLKQVRAHDGSMSLVIPQEKILKVFRITGLTKVFGIHPSVDDALSAGSSAS